MVNKPLLLCGSLVLTTKYILNTSTKPQAEHTWYVQIHYSSLGFTHPAHKNKFNCTLKKWYWNEFNWLLKMMSCQTRKQLHMHSHFFHIFPMEISHCCDTSYTQWIYSVFEIHSQCCSHLFWQCSHHKATGRVSSLLQGHLGLNIWLPLWKLNWVKHLKGDSFISLSAEAVLGVLRTSWEVLMFLLWFHQKYEPFGNWWIH